MKAATRKIFLSQWARMALLSVIWLGFASGGWAGGGADGSLRPPAESNGDDLFATNAPIFYFDIKVGGTNLTSLKKSPRTYVRVTVRVGEAVYTDVGLHLKGNKLGSFQPVDKKPGLTLNFDKFKHGQKFHGLDKIHLNNCAEDDTYMTEVICGELFRAAGLPAARANHAVVELNGRDRGLYVLKEGLDKTFLRRYFKNTSGNLYDSGMVNDIDEPLQKDSGDATPGQPDLDVLVSAAKEPDLTKRWERLEKLLDLDRFVSFLAMEVMTCHWDGYAMNRNNYRVYHDPATDKLVFIPHGMDVMFTDPSSPLHPFIEGLVARAVLESPEGSRRHLERVSTLLTNLFVLETLTNRIDQLQARIRPVLAAINRKTALEHDEAVDGLRDEIRRRVRHIDWMLGSSDTVSLKFDKEGVAKLSDWRIHDPSGNAILDKVADSDGRQTLHIRAGTDGRCRASWRTEVLVERTRYRFEALVRTEGVVPFKDKKGRGAGIRISGSEEPRSNKVVGTTRWKKVEYEFEVDGDTGNEIELVCELLVTKGEVWFDLDSLKLTRIPD